MRRASAGGGSSWECGQDSDTECGQAPGRPWGDPGVTHHGWEQKGPAPLQPHMGSLCTADQHEVVLLQKNLDYIETKRIKKTVPLGKSLMGNRVMLGPQGSENQTSV